MPMLLKETNTVFGRRAMDAGPMAYPAANTRQAAARPALRPPAAPMMPHAAPAAPVIGDLHHAAPQADDRQSSRAATMMVSSQFATKPPLLKLAEFTVLMLCTLGAVWVMLGL